MAKDFLIENVLVVQTSFIGDVILSTGVWEKIHEAHPQCKIDVLVRRGNEGLLANHPFINQVIIWEKKKNKYQNLFGLIKQLRLKKYDMLINLQRHMSTGVLSVFSGAKKTIGFKENPVSLLFSKRVAYHLAEKKLCHETDRYQALIESFCGANKSRMKLYPATSDYEKVKEFVKKPFITLSPASVWKTKELPKEKWIKLCERFSDRYEIFLCGGSQDKALCEEILEQCSGAKPKILAGKLTFLESAALFSKAKMNFCNDSAPTHIASAMNAPVTTFFISTIPEFGFTPTSDQSKVVEVNEKLACRPCGIHGKKKCPMGHFKCGNLIDIDQLEL